MKTIQFIVIILLSLFTKSFAQSIDQFDTTAHWIPYSNNPNGSNWEIGTPNYGATNSTHSGINAWDISLDSVYKSNTEAILPTPYYDFTALTLGNRISFWINQNTQNDTDGLRLEYASNGGPWQVLGSVNDPLGSNWYNSANLPNTGKAGWTGNSGGWIKSSYSLDQFASNGIMQFRFVFTSDSSVELDGVSIDDFGSEIVPIKITNAYDSIGSNCLLPQTVKLSCFGFIDSTLSPLDSITMHLLFGDGTDTTFQILLNGSTIFNPSVYHTYNLTGSYTLAHIATSSAGYIDSLISPSQVLLSNNCGNVSGNVYFDNNNNCIFDAGDSALNYKLVQIVNTTTNNSYFDFTDINGQYDFNVPIGYSYNIVYLGLTGNGAICPGFTYSGISSFPAVNNDFGISCSPGFDYTVSMTGTNYRPAFNRTFYISAYNTLCQNQNGVVKLLLDSNLTFISSNPGPSQVIGDTIIWNINAWFFANVTVHTDTQAILGTYLNNTCIVEPIVGDVNPINNIYTTSGLVSNSLDPNIKVANPPANISTNQTLTYAINFQNTGNDVAYNIFILDTLDVGLDATSISIIGSSHAMKSEILNGNVLHFMFDNILLPDSGSNEAASHGFVSYSVKPIPTLTPGTQIKNTSYIYFDFNDPIVTNTTSNTIAVFTTANEIMAAKNKAVVFPNPANEKINFKLDGQQNIETMKIINTLGQTIYNTRTPVDFLTIDVNKWNAGIYFYNIIAKNQETFTGIFSVSK